MRFLVVAMLRVRVKLDIVDTVQHATLVIG
jgi:hypothetical protein